MKLKYEVVKDLSKLMSNARITIMKSKDKPNTIILDDVITKLDKLVESKSKLANYDELNSDIKWLKKYYKEKSWNDTTRWLTNIDSTLRETFSQYIETIKRIKKESKEHKKKNLKDDDENTL